MLDESSYRAARANRIKSCPNCIRIQNIREASDRRRKHFMKQHKQFFHDGGDASHMAKAEHHSKRVKRSSITEGLSGVTQSERASTSNPTRFRNTRKNHIESNVDDFPLQTRSQESPSSRSNTFSPPSTTEMLKRQYHSRHESMDFGNQNFFSFVGDGRANAANMGVFEGTGIDSKVNLIPPPPPPSHGQTTDAFNSNSDDETEDDDSSTSSSGSYSTSSASLDLEDKFDGVQNARYVFLTLREALVNSLVIIGTGCCGFYFIEGFSFVDSWYFTTVLLTVRYHPSALNCFEHAITDRISHAFFRLSGR